MAWEFLLDFQDGGSVENIAALVDIISLSRSRAVHNKLKPVVNTLGFKMNRDITIINKLLSNPKDTLITVKKDSAAFFTGTVRTNFSVTVGAVVGKMEIECVDFAELLQRKIDSTFSWQNYKVCDATTKTSSIIHQLLVLAGFNVDDDISVSTIDKTIDYFVNISGADAPTYYDTITNLLFEFGYVWYFDESGVFNVYDFLPVDTSTSDDFDNDNMLGDFNVSRKLEDYKGIEVSWYPHVQQDDAIVFDDTTGGDDLYPCNITVGSGDFYPDGSGDNNVYCEYEFEGGEIITVIDPALDASYQAGLTPSFTNYHRRALAFFENESVSDKVISKFRITGDVVYKGDQQKTRCLLENNSQELFALDTQYITDSADADKLAIGLARYYKYSDFVYIVNSRADYQPGQFVNLSENMLGLSTVCLVVKVDDVNVKTGDKKYTLEGIEDYSAETTSREAVKPTAPPPLPGQDVTQGDISERPTYTEVVSGFDAGGGTTTPTAPTISVCKPIGFGAVFIQWEKQAALTNFARYEIQVSDDESSWYALKFDGTDWKGTLDADTDVYDESLVHNNIPLDGTEAVPADRTLYYRVRRVTKEPTASAWSTVQSSEVKGVPGSVIYQKAIDDAKLDDEAVIARTIAATALNWPEDAVAYWPMDEDDLTAGVIKDVKNGYDAAITLTPDLISGVAGGGLHLTSADGVTEGLAATRMLSTDLADPYSLSTWIRIPASYEWPTDGSSIMPGLVFSGLAGGSRGIARGAATEANTLRIGERGTTSGIRSHTYSISRDTWYHIVLIHTADRMDVYVNGNFVISKTDTLVGEFSDVPFYFASYQSLGGSSGATSSISRSVDFDVCETRVYQRELSAAEVKTLYMFKRPGSGLIVADRIAAKSIGTEKMVADFLQSLFAEIDELAAGYQGSGSFSSPVEGDYSLLIDEARISLQQYLGGGWSDVNKLSFGVLVGSLLLNMIGCRGVIHPDADTVGLNGQEIPVGDYFVFDFDGDYEDQNGNDVWSIKSDNSLSTTWKKFGTHSFFGSASGNTGTLILSAASLTSSGRTTNVFEIGCYVYYTLVEATSRNPIIEIVNLYTAGSNVLASIRYDATILKFMVTVYLNKGPVSEDSYVYSDVISSITGTAYYISFSVNLEDYTTTLTVNQNKYSGTITVPTGWTPPPTVDFYLRSPNNDDSLSSTGKCTAYVDELLISLSGVVDPDLFISHYLSGLPWSTKYAYNDLVLLPGVGGSVVIPNNLKSIDLPTSSAGLTSGQIWNDSGTLKIVT